MKLNLLLSLILCVAAGRCPAAEAPARPNILLILSDDMGFSDLGCYGGEIRTPVLDSLAADGVRFTQFYNTARCCPSRASLLTGLHPHQAGMGHMTDTHSTAPGYIGDLNDHCITIAQAMRPAGYDTYMCGKWHVTSHAGRNGPKNNWPLQRGFERYYGTITGAGSFYDPTTLCRGNTFITPDNDPLYHPQQFYYTDAITDNVIMFLQDHQRQNPARPFFFYVAYTAAHWPMQAPQEEIAKYKGMYDGGYEPIRQARFERCKKLGLISPDFKLSPQAGDWDKVKDKAWESRCMEVYAAMVSRMDKDIGRIVAELKRTGQYDNTLILFLQDNGGCAEPMGRQSNAAQIKNVTYKPMGPNELQHHIWPPMQTRDGRPVRTGPGVMPGPADTYVAYGRSWANVSNTPFREYKHWVHEGGISTPLIAHWPAGISAHGELRREPGQLPDIMATCLDVAKATYPKELNGHAITPAEGKSLVPAFADKPIERDGLFWEHEGNRAVRVGKWKLVAKGPAGAWELYDMDADRTEMDDLASAHPDLVKQLSAKWEAWGKRANVLPWIWSPSYGKPGKMHYELAAGASLERFKAPDIAGRGFKVSVQISRPGRNGVLVSQGGTSHGWSIYFENGSFCFAMRRSGRLEMVKAAADAVGDAREVSATIGVDGTVTLEAGTRQLARKKLGGPLVQHPVEGLDVGRDARNPVGDYQGPFPFAGEVSKVIVDIHAP